MQQLRTKTAECLIEDTTPNLAGGCVGFDRIILADEVTLEFPKFLTSERNTPKRIETLKQRLQCKNCANMCRLKVDASIHLPLNITQEWAVGRIAQLALRSSSCWRVCVPWHGRQHMERWWEMNILLEPLHLTSCKVVPPWGGAVPAEKRPMWSAAATLWSKKPLCLSCAGAVSAWAGEWGGMGGWWLVCGAWKVEFFCLPLLRCLIQHVMKVKSYQIPRSRCETCKVSLARFPQIFMGFPTSKFWLCFGTLFAPLTMLCLHAFTKKARFRAKKTVWPSKAKLNGSSHACAFDKSWQIGVCLKIVERKSDLWRIMKALDFVFLISVGCYCHSTPFKKVLVNLVRCFDFHYCVIFFHWLNLHFHHPKRPKK